jgi:HEPN domain-containing protein
VNENTIQYWIETAEYDLVTAEVMLTGGRYLYVGFMCHQSIEKILKAYYVKTIKEIPPYIHGLLLLAEKSKILNELSESQLNLLRELDPMNIEARYPKYKEELMKKLSQVKCEEFLFKTKELLLWINKKL